MIRITLVLDPACRFMHVLSNLLAIGIIDLHVGFGNNFANKIDMCRADSAIVDMDAEERCAHRIEAEWDIGLPDLSPHWGASDEKAGIDQASRNYRCALRSQPRQFGKLRLGQRPMCTYERKDKAFVDGA